MPIAARRNAHLADGQIRVNVKRQNGLHAFDGPLSHHLAGAAAGFLGGLKNTAPGNAERASPMKRQRGSEQNGGVRIVAAGVHDTVVAGTIGDFIFLGDGQGVNIGAQGNGGSWCD